MTLKRSGDAGFVLDLTSARSHKTSRFHGPTIQTLSSMLNEPLSLYCTEVEYDGAGNETPYLFHPTSDTSRCLPSSQWSQTVKAVMKKHAGVATPPKTLRASFVSARHAHATLI